MTIEPTMSSTYACEVSFINKQRFNEAVARGDYSCAPKVEGRARFFTARDIMGIWMYGHLIDDGIPPNRAGELACEFVNVLRSRPGIEEVLIVRDAFRRRHVVAPDDLESFKRVALDGTNIISLEKWDLRQQKDNVAHQFKKIATSYVHHDDADAD